MFLLGGDTLTDFALALLVGIGVGTWSSVVVATPLLVVFEERFGGPPPGRRPAPARGPVAEPVTAGTTPKPRPQSRRGSGRRGRRR
jgi:SecD/SecF fusion protein